MIEFTDWDYILIAVSKGETASEIKDSLQSINVDEEKIILLKPHSKN